MNKILKVLSIAIIAIILSFSIVRIGQIVFTLGLYYDYAILCNSKDAEYIKSKSGMNTKYNIVVCKGSWDRENFQASVLKNFPSIFQKKIDIQKGNYSVCEYVHENMNNKVVMLICCMPYIILSIAALVILNKVVIPRYTEESGQNEK